MPRSKTVTVTSGNTPYYIPMNTYGGQISIVATPASGNYDVAFTNEDIGSGAASVTTWVDVTNMSAATATQDEVINPASCLRITLNSGTSVTVDVLQAIV